MLPILSFFKKIWFLVSSFCSTLSVLSVRFIALLFRATKISFITRVSAVTEVRHTCFIKFFLSVIQHLCFRLPLFCKFYSSREYPLSKILFVPVIIWYFALKFRSIPSLLSIWYEAAIQRLSGQHKNANEQPILILLFCCNWVEVIYIYSYSLAKLK